MSELVEALFLLRRALSQISSNPVLILELDRITKKAIEFRYETSKVYKCGSEKGKLESICGFPIVSIEDRENREQKLMEIIKMQQDSLAFYANKDGWIDYILKGEDHEKDDFPRSAGQKARVALEKTRKMLEELK